MITTLIRSIGLLLKKLLGRGSKRHYYVNFETHQKWPLELSCTGKGYINDIEFNDNILLNRNQVFQMDNAISENLRKQVTTKSKDLRQRRDLLQQAEGSTYSELLNYFIDKSIIPEGWRYAGLYHAGYSLKHQQYILPSWIWTNGTIVQHFASCGKFEAALNLADRLLSLQLDCGGWVVRYDYKDPKAGVTSVIAPNDSAHCSNLGLLTAYRLSGDSKYLLAAEKCANWIMTNGHDQGLILHGYNSKKDSWDTTFNIVDTGFSAGLFCSLYKLTGKQDYLDFAGKFLTRYVDVFYRGKGIFATSIQDNVHYGKGIFARGHAWALEGMIPYYELTNDLSFGKIIDDTVNFLLQHQHNSGGWLYNLRSGPVGMYSGYDNKGIPIIAASLARWRQSQPSKSQEIDNAVRNAVDWCLRHTRKSFPGTGGIFACNFEGAIVHSPNTEVAFVYSNCYLLALMREYGLDNNL